jgi:hypothetical protein
MTAIGRPMGQRVRRASVRLPTKAAPASRSRPKEIARVEPFPLLPLPSRASVDGGVELGFGVADGVALGVADGVADGVALGVADGVADGVAEGVSDGVAEGVSDGVAEGVSDGVADGVSDGVADGVALGVADGLADGFGVGQPLFLSLSWTFREPTPGWKVMQGVGVGQSLRP